MQSPQGTFNTSIKCWSKDNRRRGDLDKTSLPIGETGMKVSTGLNWHRTCSNGEISWWSYWICWFRKNMTILYLVATIFSKTTVQLCKQIISNSEDVAIHYFMDTSYTNLKLSLFTNKHISPFVTVVRTEIWRRSVQYT